MSLALTDLADADLWALCRQGRAAAWAVLVRRYQRLIYTIPRRAGLDDDAAADVFQTAFSRLHEHLHRLDDPSRLRAWLVTTAKRESLRMLEQVRRVPAPASPRVDDHDDLTEDPLAQVPDPGPLPDALLASLQQHDALRRAVDQLDERSRRFVELVFLQDQPLPYSEVASRLGIAEGSIGPTRARCLAKLRAILEPGAAR